jgi:hypothetical protein
MQCIDASPDIWGAIRLEIARTLGAGLVTKAECTAMFACCWHGIVRLGPHLLRATVPATPSGGAGTVCSLRLELVGGLLMMCVSID